MVSSASAVFLDLNAWDVNGSKHANKGEDFNVALPMEIISDVNNDYNYLVVLRYQDTYVDLNVKVLTGTEAGASYNNNLSEGVDANVVSMRLAGGGPCSDGKDYNVISWNESQFNTFNVQVTIPSSGAIDTLVGKEVTVELWPLTLSGERTGTCGTAPDANTHFIIGPAIIITTPHLTQNLAKVNQSITVMGYGFTPTSSAARPLAFDNNIQIWINDANGTVMNTTTRLGDLNLTDITHEAARKYHKGGVGDNNDATTMGWNSDLNLTLQTFDANATTVYADSNGEFDVNITLPYVTPGSIGWIDLNAIRATSDKDGDINAINFAIAPKITEPADMNITITIGGNYYTIDEALTQNLISNWGAVPGVTVRMGNFVDINTDTTADHKYDIVVKFNSDLNFMLGPIRDYADMNTAAQAKGRVEINTTLLPEFSIDANIFMYNIASPSSGMPIIMKDKLTCAATTCTNIDGTALRLDYTDTATGTQSWAYNGTAGDGNISFRVNSFSVYETSMIAVELVTPNGGEKIRVPRHGADSNYTIQFRFRDINIFDNNWDAVSGGSPMKAVIHYSTVAGANTGTIINDTNLFDNFGIRCNGFSDFVYGSETDSLSDSINMAQWKTCNYDLNRSDLNRIVGEFVIDVNIVGPWGKSTSGSSDQNVFFNPPLIEITDANLNSANFVINDYRDAIREGNGALDINYVIDFNIYLPDVNSDQNFSLADYNIHFYLNQLQNHTSGDLNIGGNTTMMDQNFVGAAERKWIATGTEADGTAAALYMECASPPDSTPFWDYKCTAQLDTNHLFEGAYYLVAKIFNNKSRTVNNTLWNMDTDAYALVSHTIDTNELWDINSSAYSFSINDSNVPIASVPSATASTTSSSYTMTVTCDDNTSGISNYYFREGSNTWIDNNTDSSYTFNRGSTVPTSKVYHAGCRDYAGNVSDINATVRVTFSVAPDDPDTSGSGGGGGGAGIPSTGTGAGTIEVILEQTISNKPTAEEITYILTRAGASENAIAKASAAVAKTSVSRTIKVERITNEEGAISYRTTMTIKVTNPGAKKMKAIKVIEQIPKNVALRASDIQSDFPFTILKDDPVIEFTISSIMPNGVAVVTYSVPNRVLQGPADAWSSNAVVAEFEEIEVCEDVVCQERPCQVGTCNTTNEQCEYSNIADGTSCETGKECESGQCVDKPVVPPAEVCGNDVCGTGETEENCPEDCAEAATVGGIDIATILGALVILVLLAGGGYYYYTRYYLPGQEGPPGKQAAGKK